LTTFSTNLSKKNEITALSSNRGTSEEQELQPHHCAAGSRHCRRRPPREDWCEWSREGSGGLKIRYRKAHLEKCRWLWPWL